MRFHSLGKAAWLTLLMALVLSVIGSGSIAQTDTDDDSSPGETATTQSTEPEEGATDDDAGADTGASGRRVKAGRGRHPGTCTAEDGPRRVPDRDHARTCWTRWM